MPDLPPVRAPVEADTSGFVSNMGLAIGSLNSLGKAAGFAGGALVAFAGARGLAEATQAAAEFEKEMTRLNTLVGIQTGQVKEWEGALLDLAGAVGKTPQELGRAMFAITSGGERGAEALSLLEQSAKASAIGLGDTTDIARTATAVMQAFSEQNLSGARAIDIMLATAREGNFEVSELGGALGKATPIAAAMGVTFEEVGANVAAYTRITGNARVATTGLRAVLSAILMPSEDSRKAFDRLGISIEEMRRRLREDGLNRAMIDLLQAVEDADANVGDLIPNVRALTNALGTAGVQAEELPAILESIADSTGMVDEGFEETRKTATQAFAELNASIEALKIEVGATFLPTVTAMVRALTGLVQAIREADEATEDLALDTRVGPSADVMAAAMGRAAGATDEAAAAAKRSEAQLESTQQWIDSGREAWEELFGTLDEGEGKLPPAGLSETSVELRVLIDRAKRLSEELDEVAGAFVTPSVSLEDIEKGAEGAARAMDVGLQQQFFEWEEGIGRVKLETKEFIGINRRFPEVVRGYGELGAQATLTMEQIERSSDRAAGEITDAFADLIGGTKDVTEAFRDMVDGILREITRLVVQQTITKPIAQAISGAITSVSASGPGGSLAPIPGPRPVTVGPVGSRAGTVVNQQVNLNVSAVDARSVERLLRERSGTIAAIVGEAARNSQGFRRQVVGP